MSDSSSLDESSSCTSSINVSNPAWLTNGGFVPVILGVIVMFWGMAFICEEYCVPAITVFCKRNHIKDDFAGAFFIGTGLSLPVFFVALVGLFFSQSAIGVGAVVGGNAFNHLVTISCSIYVAPKMTLTLDALVFTREMAIYFSSCIILVWATQSGNLARGFRNAFNESQWLECLTIEWIHAFLLLVCYGLYISLDAYYYKILRLFTKLLIRAVGNSHSIPGLQISTTDTETGEKELPGNGGKLHESLDVSGSVVVDCHHRAITAQQEISDIILDIEGEIDERFSMLAECSSFRGDDDLDEEIRNIEARDQETVAEVSSPGFKVPRKLLPRLFYFLTFPMRYVIYLTVPDVRLPQHRDRCIVSFTITLGWLFIQSYILTEGLTLLGNWWNISSAVMGYSIAAWASNYPAHWSSLVTAKVNLGDVAVCNVLGSNIFNIFFALGCPWLLYCIVYGGKAYDALQDQGVVLSLLLLMFIIVLHYLMVAMNRFVLNAWMIPPMMITYFVFIVYLSYFVTTLPTE